MKYNHTWEDVENAGRLYNVELSIDYDVTPYRPAKTNCDPDDGHPEEGGDVEVAEIEVLSVHQLGYREVKWLAADLPPLVKLYWAQRFLKHIDDDFKIELAEAAAQDAEAAREAEEDSRYDTMRERDE